MPQEVETMVRSLRLCARYEQADSQLQLAPECTPPFD